MPAIPPPAPHVEIVVASQGMSKGLRQTAGIQVIVRPEVAIGHFFLGGLYKNVTSTAAVGEAAVMLGYRGRLAGVELAATAAYRWDTGAPATADRDALEFNVTAARSFGPVTPRLSLTWSPDDLGPARRSLYSEAGIAVALLRGASASAAIGRRSRDGGADYTAFNAGLSYGFRNRLTADLRYYSTDEGRLGEIYRSRLVASLRARF
jgi:hypothetical protein